MNGICLKFPGETMGKEAIEFRQEFFDKGENAINGGYKWDSFRYTYKEWLEVIRDNLDKDKVNPKFGFSHTMFAVDSQDRIVGVVNFRHEMTDFYKNAGHIGYSVRPTERGKGYATEILNQTLAIAKNQGLSKVYLICRKNNEPSRKTILKNHGSLVGTFINKDTEYEKYCIELKDTKQNVKSMLVKEINNTLDISSDLKIEKLTLEGDELKQELTKNLTDFIEGTLDPDLAGRSSEKFITNIQKNLLGDFSKRYIIRTFSKGKPMGILIALPMDEETSHILSVHVSPACRNKGAGFALLTTCQNQIYKEGKRRLIIDVHSENTPAYHLYKKFGFTELKVERD